MNAAIIATGAELLAGHVIDSNSQFIADHLRRLGIDVRGIYISDDKKEDIIRMIKTASENADLIIMTGGLGPTDDDLSREAFAEALDRELIYSEKIAEKLKSFFSKRGYTMTKNNLRQAYLPVGAEAINNDNGTAPALRIKDSEKNYYLMPGVPSEMKLIFEKYILKELKEMSTKKIICRQFNFLGIGESTLASELEKLDIDNRISLSYQAARGKVKIRLKMDSQKYDEDLIEVILDHAEKKIIKSLSEYIISLDSRGIMDILIEEINKKGYTIAAAESFTGGLIAETLSERAGSSEFFNGAVVAYNNQAKINLLNVDSKLLKKHGAVSRECVRAMAAGAAEIFGSDITISTSGAAGPEGLEGKKAGTMHIAVKFNKEFKDIKLEKNLGRSLNRYYASQIALFEVLKLLRKNIR